MTSTGFVKRLFPMVARWKSNGWLSISREPYLIGLAHMLYSFWIAFLSQLHSVSGTLKTNEWNIYHFIFVHSFFILIKCEFWFFETLCRSQRNHVTLHQATTEKNHFMVATFVCATMTFAVFRTIFALFNAPIVHASVGRCAWRYIPMATDLMHWKTGETISEN